MSDHSLHCIECLKSCLNREIYKILSYYISIYIFFLYGEYILSGSKNTTYLDIFFIGKMP